VLDPGALADVVGLLAAAQGVVADGHPLPAATAHDDALEQRGSFARRAGLAVGAVPAADSARRAWLASNCSAVM
jgi:hypothetical protein